MRITTIAILVTILSIPTIWAEGDAAAETAVVGADAATQEDLKIEEKDGKRVFQDRVVVTASRQEQASSQTPAAISVIDAEELPGRPRSLYPGRIAGHRQTPNPRWFSR